MQKGKRSKFFLAKKEAFKLYCLVSKSHCHTLLPKINEVENTCLEINPI